MRLRSISRLTPVIGLALLIGCGPDLEQQKNEAQQALSVGNFSQARELSSQALEQTPASEKRLLWALERIHLEALARENQGEQARETLERLAGEYPTQAKASLYLAIATYLKDAGGTSSAIATTSISRNTAGAGPRPRCSTTSRGCTSSTRAS